jgi:hypothetical protein
VSGPTAALDRVHRLVGALDQVMERDGTVWYADGAAHAQRDAVGAVGDLVVARQRLEEPRAQHVDIIGIPFHQGHELVASQPRDHVRAAQHAMQDGRDVHQRIVAAVVAELVVDVLHAIDVDEQQAHSLAMTRGEA